MVSYRRRLACGMLLLVQLLGTISATGLRGRKRRLDAIPFFPDFGGGAEESDERERPVDSSLLLRSDEYRLLAKRRDYCKHFTHGGGTSAAGASDSDSSSDDFRFGKASKE